MTALQQDRRGLVHGTLAFGQRGTRHAIHLVLRQHRHARFTAVHHKVIVPGNVGRLLAIDMHQVDRVLQRRRRGDVPVGTACGALGARDKDRPGLPRARLEPRCGGTQVDEDGVIERQYLGSGLLVSQVTLGHTFFHLLLILIQHGLLPFRVRKETCAGR